MNDDTSLQGTFGTRKVRVRAFGDTADAIEFFALDEARRVFGEDVPCPVESASLVLRLKDGRKMEYAVSEPDAARLLCDYPAGRYPSDDDVLYGPLPIEADIRVLGPRPPLQFTVTFGFRLMRRDEFLRVTETPAEDAGH